MIKTLEIKVCGMRNTQNILDVAALKPDYMGFIFFEKSPRNVTEIKSLETILSLPKEIKKVGVFVNESLENIVKTVRTFGLSTVQLHGNESTDICKRLKVLKLEVWKAFSVDQNFDFEICKPYQNTVDRFLFDTKGEGYGGHGKTFDWNILKKYNQRVPFMLAGGISLENLTELQLLDGLNIAGIDVNSKFENSPGDKNIEKLQTLFEKIKA
jgi:phosphoribosylanthranilate isomerase